MNEFVRLQFLMMVNSKQKKEELKQMKYHGNVTTIDSKRTNSPNAKCEKKANIAKLGAYLCYVPSNLTRSLE